MLENLAIRKFTDQIWRVVMLFVTTRQAYFPRIYQGCVVLEPQREMRLWSLRVSLLRYESHMWYEPYGNKSLKEQ